MSVRTTDVLRAGGRAGGRLTNEQNSFGVEDATPYQEWAQIMQECLEVAREKGELADGVNAHMVAEFVVAACTGMQVYSWIVSGRKNLSERAVQMWKILLPCIATPSGAAGAKVSTRRGATLVR
ncbi:hypothetical protein ACFYNY_00145 [Streptomyces sp. NPDC006530]|uniref:hypothetical protein n=1 Tax=Streptomyces sp. NPDC006530 TaxID=3364750 RepID=UPI003673878D